MMIYIWLAHNIPSTMKFTMFIKKSVDKNESVSSKHGGFKKLLKPARKKLF